MKFAYLLVAASAIQVSQKGETGAETGVAQAGATNDAVDHALQDEFNGHGEEHKGGEG